MPMPLPCRTPLLAACSVALASLVPVALYQLHAIGHLPDPPGRWFNSDTITASPAAHPLGIPDSLPGLASYAATLALILASRRSGPARRLLGAKLALDGAAATFNFVRQIVAFRCLCSWCTLTAAATAVMVYTGRQAIAHSAGAAVSAARSWTESEDQQPPVLDALSPSS